MTSYSSWQRKLALIFKSEKTLDAPSVIAAFSDKTIADMKSTIITSAMCRDSALTDKPRIKNLIDHLDKLKHEFIGKPELCYYHATLIILIRRNYKVADLFPEFERLWSTQTDYLLYHLSLRWIVSACDTFIDHTVDPLRAAIFMNAVTLINTLKVYETQQYLQRQDPKESLALVPERVEALYNAHLPLFEGLTYFRIGADDTLRNMRIRYNRLAETDKLATTVLLSIFDQLQTINSGFNTMKNLHKDEKSNWWST